MHLVQRSIKQNELTHYDPSNMLMRSFVSFLNEHFRAVDHGYDLREVKVPVLNCGGVFKDYELHKVCALSADIAAMDVLSLNYWLSKFVMEVAKKSGERYPPKSVYGIICSLKHHLEEE